MSAGDWPEDDLETETMESLQGNTSYGDSVDNTTLNQTADESLMNDEFLQEAIKEHAKFLGMDPEVDTDHLWIAEEALTAPLPEGWQQAEAEDGTPYHFNPDTGESLWEHPLDEVYRQKFADAKANGTKNPALKEAEVAAATSAAAAAAAQDAFADQLAADQLADQQARRKQEQQQQQQQRKLQLSMKILLVNLSLQEILLLLGLLLRLLQCLTQK